MAKSDKASSAPDAADQANVDQEIPLTLEEFCTRLSASDKRVEMIGAFFKTETASGRTKDVDSGFVARFIDFTNQPA